MTKASQTAKSTHTHRAVADMWTTARSAKADQSGAKADQSGAKGPSTGSH